MIGTRLDHYEITAKLGEGGMGEVWRARDHQLHRDVAIKLLTAERLASDDARQRFEREARAVAALSHPNILAIHGFGEHDGRPYAVTELLEGQTLDAALAAGGLPVRRALELAAQAADGLAAAHERGIVHRDIKPSNLWLTPDGRLIILDFGLAKAALDTGDQAKTQGIDDRTAPGTVMGTVCYMAPEQVRGAEVDGRSDIFALGAVLWEMLGGERAFDRPTAVEAMNAILNEDPPTLTSKVEDLPPPAARIVERCLEKAPAQRFQSARDLAFALRSARDSSSRSFAPGELPTAAAVSRGRWRWTVPAGFLVLGALAGALLTGQLREEEPHKPIKVRPLTHTGRDSGPSASPDGRTLAFVSDRDGEMRIWLRQMAGGAERPLTDGPDFNPAFSPDGSSILFLRGTRDGNSSSIFRVPTLGGTPRRLIADAFEGVWSPEGDRIAYLRSVGDAVLPRMELRVRELQGGGDTLLSAFTEMLPYGIRWSPDGRWISTGSSGYVQNVPDNKLFLVDAASGEVRELRNYRTRVSSPSWAPGGDALIAAISPSLMGDISSPVGLVHRIEIDSDRDTPMFWVQSVWGGASDFVRFDRLGEHDLVFDENLWRAGLWAYELQGGEVVGAGRRLTHGNARDRQPAFAPDSQWVAFSTNRSGNLDLWQIQVDTGEVQQLTDDVADDWDPAFTADGQGLLWSSNRGGHLEIWQARADGSGARQLTLDGVDAENPTQTPDGRYVAYGSANPERPGIWLHDMETGEERVIAAGGSYLLPELSPDGQYVAYSGARPNLTGVGIEVRRLSDGELVWETEVSYKGFQASVAVGRCRWLPGSNELVFIDEADGQTVLLAQPVVPGEDTLDRRRVLLRLPDRRDAESFGISPDGRTLVVSNLEYSRSLKLAEGVFGER